jgi:Zn-dependent M28 family amino/carboxypeptidase
MKVMDALSGGSMPLVLSPESRSTAGILLLTIVAIEYGGWFMLRVVRGRQPATPFQQAFFRAGHAHAGVLVILALVSQLFVDATHLGGALAYLARNGIPAAAILMSAGFFLAAAGREVTKPNRFIWLLYAGAVALGLGVVALGIGLLMT